MRQELKDVAQKIDSSFNVSSLKNILEKITKNSFKEEFSNYEKATLYFYIANIHSGIRKSYSNKLSWDWHNTDLINEIYNLRKSLEILLLIPVENDLKFRVNTNLANALNHIGRPAEALEIYNDVLCEKPDFSMANANKGYSIKYYARSLYDKKQKVLFMYDAYKFMKMSLDQGLEAHAIEEVKRECEEIKKLVSWEGFNISPESKLKYCSKLEKKYRIWSADNCLFLNPLNDLTKCDIVANDCITISSIIVPLRDEPNTPEVFGIYNQLKQEYISARYILFEATKMTEDDIHFSDKEVLLCNMLDYRMYGISIEKIKMAFLSTYAIFDKISYLINEYWQLGFNTRDINFNKIWFNKLNKNQGLSDIFLKSENLSLMGLYWISRDLYRIDGCIMDPNSKKINEIRNHISHKYLTIYSDDIYNISRNQQNTSYSISNKELEKQAIKLLKLARNALIYVSLSIHRNECKNKPKKTVLPVSLYNIKRK